jgi:hypothetical protein
LASSRECSIKTIRDYINQNMNCHKKGCYCYPPDSSLEFLLDDLEERIHEAFHNNQDDHDDHPDHHGDLDAQDIEFIEQQRRMEEHWNRQPINDNLEDQEDQDDQDDHDDQDDQDDQEDIWNQLLNIQFHSSVFVTQLRQRYMYRFFPNTTPLPDDLDSELNQRVDEFWHQLLEQRRQASMTWDDSPEDYHHYSEEYYHNYHEYDEYDNYDFGYDYVYDD